MHVTVHKNNKDNNKTDHLRQDVSWVCGAAKLTNAVGGAVVLGPASFIKPIPLTSSNTMAKPPSEVAMAHSAALDVRCSRFELARAGNDACL